MKAAVGTSKDSRRTARQVVGFDVAGLEEVAFRHAEHFPPRRIARVFDQEAVIAPHGFVGVESPLELVANPESCPEIEPRSRMDHGRQRDERMRFERSPARRIHMDTCGPRSKDTSEFAEGSIVVLDVFQNLGREREVEVGIIERQAVGLLDTPQTGSRLVQNDVASVGVIPTGAEIFNQPAVATTEVENRVPGLQRTPQRGQQLLDPIESQRTRQPI